MMELKKNAEEFNSLSNQALLKSPEQQKELNKALYMIEHSLINEDGLPRRPWYKHQIYAPGYYTGYGVKTMPGIREGIEQRAFSEAQDNIYKVSKSISTYSDQVSKITSVLRPRP